MLVNMSAMQWHGHSPGVVSRSIVIGLMAFLTIVDLFATQAILPSLTRHYDVTPAAMGFAVNASTMGMAIAGLVVGFFSPRIDRRSGILASSCLPSRQAYARRLPISSSSQHFAWPRDCAWRRHSR